MFSKPTSAHSCTKNPIIEPILQLATKVITIQGFSSHVQSAKIPKKSPFSKGKDYCPAYYYIH